MRGLITALGVLTIVACTWLVAMYFVLHRGGYLERAALVAGLGVIATATLISTWHPRPPLWLRATVAAGSLILIYSGVTAIRGTLQSDHFEGYALISGALFTALGLAGLVRAATGTTLKRSAA